MSVSGADATEAAVVTQQKFDALQAFVMHHVVDSHEWLLPFVGHPVRLPALLSLHSVMLIIGAVLLVLCGLSYKRNQAVPTGLSSVLEAFVAFIRDEIAVPFLGRSDGARMTPVFCSFFFFIAMMNLMGLFPAFATATSNLSVTAAMAITTLAFMIVGGMVKNGPLGFFKAFAPHGVPWPVLIILAPIEFMGMFLKAFALTIRLFANMLAGHIVLFFVLGLIFVFGVWGLPIFAMAVLINLIEVFICLLQAYVFTLLSAMFIGQVWHPQH